VPQSDKRPNCHSLVYDTPFFGEVLARALRLAAGYGAWRKLLPFLVTILEYVK
jgi:hypothetical protein